MIIWDDGSNAQNIYDMWQRNFQDPVRYADFYFKEVYGKNRVLLSLTEEEDETVIRGMIHLNPYRLHARGKSFPASYIVGVATDEDYRRQGVMRELLARTFSSLREEGQPFTYLMPADENYYLPFDFRFGMTQFEQELVLLPEMDRTYAWEFRTEMNEEDLDRAARMENAWKQEHFDLFTEIDIPYLRRLEKETLADFGRMYYVYCDGAYCGRASVVAEFDSLVLSRIFVPEEHRDDFVRELVRFVASQYQYTNYQVILDSSWADRIRQPGRFEDIRFMKPAARQKIMFRILDLEKMGDLISCREDALPADSQVLIHVEDPVFPAQEGDYVFRPEGAGLKIVRVTGQEAGEDLADGGTIGIGDLTAWFFGSLEENEPDSLSGLTDAGRELLSCLQPLKENCILEIV